MNELQIITQNNERVLTTARLAEQYGTTERRVSENFNANKSRYTEGKHYYCLEGKTLKDFKNNYGISVSVGERTAKLYLWTEKGALLHAKSLNTDKAWQVYEFLVDNYFNPKQKSNTASITDHITEIKIRASADRAAAMKMNAENRRLKLLLEHPHLQDLSPIAKQVFALKSIEDTTGTSVSNVLPECGELYGAGQLAERWTKEFGVKVTANMLGKLANAHGLKDDKHGIVAMDKSPNSSKEIPSFRYNRKGADELKVLAMEHYGIKISK